MRIHKLIILFAFTNASINAYAQKRDIVRDNKVYSAILETSFFDNDKVRFKVYRKTSTNLLKLLDYKHIELNGLPLWIQKDTLIGTKQFFGSIDTGSFKNYELSLKIRNHEFIDTIPSKSIEYYSDVHYLILSPVIYSKNGRFALCTVANADGGLNAYILVFEKQKWRPVNE